jgi:hypothetical protein
MAARHATRTRLESPYALQTRRASCAGHAGSTRQSPKPSGSDLAATYTAFYKKGTLRGTTLVTPATRSDGTTSFTGKLQVKGGTGRYKGAKGKDIKITGTLSGNVLTFQLEGTVRY